MDKSSGLDLTDDLYSEIFTDYHKLREDADLICSSLTSVHLKNLNCAPGCHKCCMDFSIFPVEFYSILKESVGKKIKTRDAAPEEECLFLLDGLCSIYEFRPLICRTHGLPMLYMGEEEWELSYCDLNFTDRNQTEFTESNTFPQDLYNSELFLINRKFINSIEDKRYLESDLLSLRELAVQINQNSI
jgi:Fe-S-cluster containining protein